MISTYEVSGLVSKCKKLQLSRRVRSEEDIFGGWLWIGNRSINYARCNISVYLRDNQIYQGKDSDWIVIKIKADEILWTEVYYFR